MNKYLMPLIIVPLAFSQNIAAQQDNRPQGGGHPHFLKLFDSNNDGQVTQDEFNTAMQQRYQQMDADDNGSVSIEEFKQHAAEHRKNWQRKMHGKMDRDGDGAISKQEFIDRAVKRAERRFGKLDTNGDGVLSEQENVRRQPRKEHRLLEKMDKNQDGLISREEHAETARQWFEKLDVNSDKVVTGDELKGWRKQRQ